MAKPRLSIVTITYKDIRGLEDTIQSLEPIATQTDWEHVIVDSSPEESRDLLHELKKRNWPFRHLVVPPKGIYSAINEGVRGSTGEYLWFLNGGDKLYHSRAIDKVFETYEANPELEFVASTVEFRRDNHYMYFHRPYPSIYRSLVGLNRLCHQGIIYRRIVFEKVGLFSEKLKLAADYEHHLRCIASGVQMKALPYNIVGIYDMSGLSMQYKVAFDEFAQVQRDLAPRLPQWFNLANQAVRPLEYAKIFSMKALSGSPVASVLKPIWLAFKRNHYR